jgi:hypothetical protein
LRVCMRGFSEGKSDVTNTQRPLIKHYTAIIFSIHEKAESPVSLKFTKTIKI